jgi:2-polyprenyl-3-methyl-5-hydroxy-6-metoxy-1,4-benzoquinol methylase
MRTLDCPLCGANNFSVKYEAQLDGAEDAFHYLTEKPCHYRVVTCNECGLAYSTPIFSEEKIIELYKNCAIEEAVGETEDAAIRTNMRRYLDRLSRDSGKRSGKLLDVGCGPGHLLEEARKRGYDAVGVDPSAEAVKHVQARLGKNSAINAPYSKELFPENSFDLITLVHVIDHVVEPKKLLETMRYHLKPGGHVFIATHNIDSWLAKLTGKGFIAWSVQHITYYTPGTLREMTRRAGFSPVSTRGSLTTYPLSHFAKNGLRTPWLRDLALRALNFTRLGSVPISFPFGNLEVVCNKPAGSVERGS